MNITHYSRNTGEPLSQGLADADPKNSGHFLIPAYATPDTVPEVEENQCAVFTDENGAVPRSHKEGEWKIVADHRGYFGYDANGNEQQISELGIEPDESWTLTKPEPPFVFADAAQLKNNEIKNGFQAAVQAITTTYTQEEISTFLTQENEALAWQADNNALTPGIDYIVANRPSVDKATLVSSIISNATTYKDIVFPAMGKKQAYEDKLYALQIQHEDSEQPDVTQADIDAIIVDFS
ncbi:hypothetical protein GCM10007891_05510 [Methylophaga thalassica]|uniref:Uncharacterized protein n=1 Tax=Methylophaga thalassica TaxID=40223 RepID=A0ABQ5TTH0_9GAMM|nr:hypothetical protein [Methylophaga thalassica]GLP98697.1 hypothetical protein GCM10007891_05510 [Methylophaga thalassica]